MALAAIKIEHLNISFEGHVVLSDVNLSVSESEAIVIIGPSGQGKSVLLKLMAGLIKPTIGKVLFHEEDLAEVSGARRQKLINKMGMLFQKNALFDSLTCGENIAFPLREVTDQTEAQIQGICAEFLEAVGIAHAKDLFPDEISGGMQKRLGIARALALHPEVIFYDDPTAGLDPITSRKIIELILRLKKQNSSTLVAVTNDMNRAFQMADRIWMVFNHEVIDAGTVEQTRSSKDPRVSQFIRGQVMGPITPPAEVS